MMSRQSVPRMENTIPASRLARSGIFLAAILLVPVAYGSDIGGEVVPPVCQYDEHGVALPTVPPECSQPFRISNVFGNIGDQADLIPNLGKDPWLLNETMSGNDLALQFHGTFGAYFPVASDPLTRGNTTDSNHAFARWFSLTVQNTSSHPWTGFSLELRSDLDLPSDDDDTIGFGEIFNAVTLYGPPSSGEFHDANFLHPGFEAFTRDILIFTDGQIAPSETAHFNFLISSNTTQDFYLIQHAATVPEPASMLLSAAGLAVLFLVLRKGLRSDSKEERIQ